MPQGPSDPNYQRGLNILEEELARLMMARLGDQTRPRMAKRGDEYPLTPPNPLRTASPPVMGSPMLQQLVREYSRMVPEISFSAPRIVESATPAVAEEFEDSGMPLAAYPRSNLLGMTDLQTGEVSVNPGLRTAKNPMFNVEETLAHELAHTLGHGHDRDMVNIEGLARMRSDAKRKERVDRQMAQADRRAARRTGADWFSVK